MDIATFVSMIRDMPSSTRAARWLLATAITRGEGSIHPNIVEGADLPIGRYLGCVFPRMSEDECLIVPGV